MNLHSLYFGLKIGLLVTVWSLLICDSAQAQLAPGPLTKAHGDLNGITGCTDCHGLLRAGLKCLDCHTEIKRRVEAGQGYHAAAWKNSAGNCARCHVEHRGPQFQFVPLDRNNFDHGAQTGFSLEGRHREQKCENCHTSANIAPESRPEIKLKDISRSFLGLRRDCSACHREPHQNQLGSDCSACHNNQAWRPAPKFNHSRASFSLTGLHQQVSCEKCHAGYAGGSGESAKQATSILETAPGKKVLLFKGLSFGEGCQSCHTDRHKRSFQAIKPGSKCSDCHNTGGWRSNRPGSSFAHNSTQFSLSGKHAELSCLKCHKDGNFLRALPHQRCGDCHTAPHKGQFDSLANGPDCSQCHNTSQFKSSRFNFEAHNKAFPLLGKHSTLPCDRCHGPEGGQSLGKSGKPQCSTCHTGPHGSEFASEPYNNQCNLCHTEQEFETTTFSVQRHAQTRFPLTDKHAEVACDKCHKPVLRDEMRPSVEGTKSLVSTVSFTAVDKIGTPSAAVENRRRHRFGSISCDACHADPHALNPRTGLACETCHTPKQWQALLPFDHSRIQSKLEGQHSEIANLTACIRCHEPSEQKGLSSPGTVPVFSSTSVQCSRCHAEKDPHGGQFSAQGKGRKECASCHAMAAWKAVRFDHNNTRFVLDDTHRGADCAKCHKESDVDGKRIRLYRDTPFDCLKCH